ncbi:uncharacterized protein LOC110629902 [Manihot esculenta]|uniref:Uncharacterized protein n=1 Tax=Manihot esculenta TaxID=3983 RepID=A0A2C9UR01_MANES|nr:uncharacterized protein LOC110629902 [Manihot esculenta]OAY33670.1 hypothetical protein MANES_13G115300v8 [Manihot esculenta]
MGITTSFLRIFKGLPSARRIAFVMGKLYKQFVDKDIKNFEEFHIAVLDIFNTLNSALPGKHYDAPSRKEVEACFASLKDVSEAKRKQRFIHFMKKRVDRCRREDSTMVTGVITPVAAMAAKKAAENVPQLDIIKVVPDVVFVPTVTLLAIFFVKLIRIILLRRIASPYM